MSFYLEDADITLRSDHLPLQKFLGKDAFKSKVNNWAAEIKQYWIKFEYVKGIKNTLADTMSTLIKLDPNISETHNLKVKSMNNMFLRKSLMNLQYRKATGI